jgi:primary-amine oxidase
VLGNVLAQPQPDEDRINRPGQAASGKTETPPRKPIKPAKTAKPDAAATAVNEIIQEFPTNDSMQTAWKVHWGQKSGNGLYLHGAWFKRAPGEDWLQVLGDARLAEAFVPYAVGSPRFWDVSYNFPLCVMTKEDAGPFGKLLGKTPTNSGPTIVQEIRDRGIAWKSEAGVRRGQTMVLWGALNAANYRYLIEFGFQDDGVITFRLGSTGHNYAGREWTGHMHNGLWRIDVNLDGPDHNSVLVMEHKEPGDMDPKKRGQAKTLHLPFNDGKEGYVDWDPVKFTMVRVINEKRKNARGEPIGYDLMPMRMGNSRHFGSKDEECTQHDFWVTRNRPGEMNYRQLPKYVAGHESITDTDVVLWYSTPAHHEPRSEDGEMSSLGFKGCTPVMWAGFDLKPRNVFDRTPYFPYPNTPVKKAPLPKGPVVLNLTDKLSVADSKDPQRKAFRKIHPVMLKEGKSYTIDMISTEFDSYLRLEDAMGKRLQEDDDSGGNFNARITFICSKTAEYKIICTSFGPQMTGNYTLTVQENIKAQ